ncbi:hypothetical protein HN747_02380 [archaeon]|nr:hypothetical protein [archaeon]
MGEEEKTCEQEYKELSSSLPSFEMMAEDFDIEKAFEKETSFIGRDIRHTMVEKITAYSQLFETFQNPSSPPMFIFSLIRNMTSNDKDLIQKTYNALAKIQIESTKLDTVYNEEKEITFIKETFDIWQGLKVKILELIEKLGKETEKSTASTTKGYFG